MTPPTVPAAVPAAVSAELLPCPCCGDTDLEGGIFPIDRGETMFAIRCGNREGCGISMECTQMDDIEGHPRDRLRKAWNRRSQPEAGEWQPIATAPRDGTRVLIACIGECGALWMYVAWNKRSIWRVLERKDGSHIDVLDTPTHWRPLPAPPTPPYKGDERE